MPFFSSTLGKIKKQQKIFDTEIVGVKQKYYVFQLVNYQK